tara:strand:- start:1441 stop:1782 length:342 start_codon:yes stop_codon:yes gene_type:complete
MPNDSMSYLEARILIKKQEARISNLESDLRAYKDTVHQLSFDLEMKEASLTSVRVDGIRKMALAQAARHVMGFFGSGSEIERLCREIEGLKTAKEATMEAAYQKMQEAFGHNG